MINVVTEVVLVNTEEEVGLAQAAKVRKGAIPLFKTFWKGQDTVENAAELLLKMQLGRNTNQVRELLSAQPVIYRAVKTRQTMSSTLVSTLFADLMIRQ